MASETSASPNWVSEPPSQFDIVACYFPETKPKAALALRPCLVENVYQSKKTGLYAVDIAFGTKNLKMSARAGLDVIVHNSGHLDAMGLAMSTRFDLASENQARLPWNTEFFGCWTGYRSPIIGFLMPEYQKEYAYCKLRRASS